MEHGRDHDERQAHARPGRANNTPDDPEAAGLDAEADRPHGSEVAPTHKAAERERERHRLEREMGVIPAGASDGLARQVRDPDARRDQLAAAEAEADRRVGAPGRPSSHDGDDTRR